MLPVAIAAPDVKVLDKFSFSEISVEWKELAHFNISRGTILEYWIEYWPVEIEFESKVGEVKRISVSAPGLSATLVNLTAFAKYAVRVAAATQHGHGVFSQLLYAGKTTYFLICFFFA